MLQGLEQKNITEPKVPVGILNSFLEKLEKRNSAVYYTEPLFLLLLHQAGALIEKIYVYFCFQLITGFLFFFPIARLPVISTVKQKSSSVYPTW